MLHTKRFDEWNTVKKIINEKRGPLCKAKEIWYAHVGHNVGDEEDGKGNEFRRPVLVLKKINNNLFLGVPLSSKQKNHPYYIRYDIPDRFCGSALASQLRVFDAKRLIRRMAKLPHEEFIRIVDEVQKTATPFSKSPRGQSETGICT